MSKKVVHLNYVLEEAVSFLSENIENIVDLVVLVKTRDGEVRYINSTEDTNFLYLAHRKVREDLDDKNCILYDDYEEEEFIEV